MPEPAEIRLRGVELDAARPPRGQELGHALRRDVHDAPPGPIHDDGVGLGIEVLRVAEVVREGPRRLRAAAVLLRGAVGALHPHEIGEGEPWNVHDPDRRPDEVVDIRTQTSQVTREPVRLFVESLPFDAAEGPPLRTPPRILMDPQTLKERLELALELGDGHRLEYRARQKRARCP